MKWQTITFPAIAAALLVGCGGGSDGGSLTGPEVGSDQCSIDGQKQFVLDSMRDVYFWNDLLPATVNLNDFATPEALLASLTSVQPLDRFSFINSAAADSAFFGEGQFVGFGFSTRQVADNDIRFTRVFGASPADLGGIRRGQRLLAVDGRTVEQIQAAEGLSEAFGPAEEGVVRVLRINDNGVERDVTLTKAVVTIDPVPQVRAFEVNNVSYGYIEFATFISTANDQLDTAFSNFRTNNITSLIIDMRYNGGGLVSVAERLGDLLGGDIAESEIFSETLFNQNNSASNNIRRFARLAQSINLTEVVVLTSGSTASASELVINGLEPVTSVRLVGADTFGKPVGQVGITFCEKILRPTAFETVNSLGEGGFFDGLPVDCEADDDLNFVVGAEDEPMVAAALTLLSTGSCPPPTTLVQQKQGVATRADWRVDTPRNAAEEHAYAF
ncbi:MAG: S41 family peptidase [Pseudomonadota bacterium]